MRPESRFSDSVIGLASLAEDFLLSFSAFYFGYYIYRQFLLLLGIQYIGFQIYRNVISYQKIMTYTAHSLWELSYSGVLFFSDSPWFMSVSGGHSSSNTP